MRDKKSDTKYEFKLNFKEIILFIVGSIGVISLFFIVGIWIGKSLNAVPAEMINDEYLTEKDFPDEEVIVVEEKDEKETEIDITKKEKGKDSSYEFQDSLNDDKIIPLNDKAKKPVKKDEAAATKAKKAKKDIDNFSVPEKKKPKVAVKKEEPKAKGTGKFTVQLASLKSDKAALKLVTKLEKKGYDAYFVASNIKGKGVWFRVRVGNYHSNSDAENMIKALEKSVKMKGMVVRDDR